MIVKRRETKPHETVVDLTSTPYFSTPPVPQQPSRFPEASSRERLRDLDDDVIVIPDYRTDRPPAAYDSSLRFGGGLGSAATFDVKAHPVRARLHSINILSLVAITVVVGIGLVMLTMVVAFKQ